jgi:hypothetical protein
MAITVQSNIAFGFWFKVNFCDEHHMAIPRLHGLLFDKAKVSVGAQGGPAVFRYFVSKSNAVCSNARQAMPAAPV